MPGESTKSQRVDKTISKFPICVLLAVAFFNTSCEPHLERVPPGKPDFSEIQAARRLLWQGAESLDCRWINGRIWSVLKPKPYLPSSCGASLELRKSRSHLWRTVRFNRALLPEGIRAELAILRPELDLALSHYETAARDERLDPEMYLGLSAAYLELAIRNNDWEPAFQGLSLVARAASANPDPRILEALFFNRALLLEQLGLWRACRSAWLQWIQKYPDSPWRPEAEDALRRLPSLEPPTDVRTILGAAIESRRLDKLIEIIETHAYIVRDWCDARLADLGHCRQVGCQEQDEIEADIRWIADQLAHKGYPLLKAALMADNGALSWIDVWTPAYRSNSWTAANIAARELEAAGNPWHFQARYLELRRLWRQDRKKLAILARSLRHSLEGEPFPELLARTLWLEALNRAEMGEMAESNRLYAEAERIYLGLGESEQALRLRLRRAANLKALGDHSESLRVWQRLLLRHPPLPDSERHILLADLSSYLTAQRFFTVARDVAYEMELQRSLDPLEGVLAHRCVINSQIEIESGNNRKALDMLESCRELRDSQSTDVYSIRLDLLMARAKSRDPDTSARALRSALEDYKRQNIGFLAAPLYRRLGALLVEQGFPKEAADLLNEGVSYFEHRGLALKDPWLRARSFEELRLLVEQLVDLALRFEKSPARAFDIAETGRARSLLTELTYLGESRNVGNLQPLTLHEIQEGLPPGTAMLNYFSLPDKLIGWVISNHGLEGHRQIGLTPNRLSELSNRLLEGISKSSASYQEARGRLALAVLDPFREILAPFQSVIVVPDLDLSRVPFTLLDDGLRANPDFASRTWSKSPSASSFILALRNSAAGPPSNHAPLIIGSPINTEARDSLGLEDLPHAAEEALAIGKIWGSEPFLGGAGTEELFRSKTRNAPIIHFAGHAGSDPRRPARNWMVLAPTKSDDGILYAHEIPDTWSGSQLVVLSACEGGVGPIAPSEGVQSLTTTLLARGVSAVIASQWKAHDSSTKDLMVAFHQHYKSTNDLNLSLRFAQDRLRETHPYYWAGFEVWGGLAKPPR